MEDALRNSAAHVFVEDLDNPVLGENDQHHLARVLRVRTDETISLSDGKGSWRLAIVGAVSKAAIEIESLEPIHNENTDIALGVAFPMLKGDRTELVVQKLTELGMSDLYLLQTDRGVVDAMSFAKKKERLEAVAREAAMQSRRTTLPTLYAPQSLSELQTILPGVLGVAEPGAGELKPDLSVVAIGPEGGWSEDEQALGLPAVGLGPTILRAETAALVAADRLAEHRFGQ